MCDAFATRRPRWYSGLWLALLCGCAAHAQGAFPAAEPAVGLLSGPVQATWAANALDYWRETGFRGFILEGICDDPTRPIWGRDGDPYSMDEDDALLKEVKLACSRLAQAGIDRHFALLRLAPEAPLFQERALSLEMFDFFAAAGRFCRLAGLRGLAVDSDSLNPLFTFTWDGYAGEKARPALLDQGAREFGKGALRAFAKEFPDGELLVMADSVRDAGPLWFSFFDGLVAGIGAADTLRIHLLTAESAAEVQPAALSRILACTNAHLRARSSEDARRLWSRYGSVALGFRPLQTGASGPAANYPPEAFHLQVAVAKALCDRYFWVDSPGAAWWQIPPEQAAQYATLYQAGGLAAGQTQPTLAELPLYFLHSPVDGLQRVGPLPWHGTTPYVCAGATGAAVLFWEGLPDSLPIAANQPRPRVFDLRTGRELELKKRSREIPAGPEPVLVEALPHGRWALPAALHAAPEAALAAGNAPVRIEVGVINPLEGNLIGGVQAWPQEGLSLGEASFPVSLAPRAAALLTRTLQGARLPGPGIYLDLTLSCPESTDPACRTVKRRFLFDVVPETLWERPIEGTPVGQPFAGDTNGDGTEEIIATDRYHTACFNAAGALLWEARWRATPAAAARPVRTRLGVLGVAMLDRWGIVRLLDSQGRELSTVPLDLTPVAGAVRFADLYGSGADVILIGDELGRVSCVTLDGSPLWRVPVHAPPCYVTWAPQAGLVVVACMDGTIRTFDRDGQPRWISVTAGAPSCEPVVMHEGPHIQIVTGSTNGHVQTWDPETGLQSADWVVAYESPVTALCAADIQKDKGDELLAGSQDAVLCLNRKGQPLWKVDVPDASGISAAPLGNRALIVVSCRDGLRAYDAEGAPLWRDSRAAWGVPAPAVLGRVGESGEVFVVYGGGDGMLRRLRIGPDTAIRPAAPR